MSDQGGERTRWQEQDWSRGGPDLVSPWEWVAGGISSLLVLAAIGFMAFEAFDGPGTPPVIEIEVDSIVESGDGYLAEFRARNTGRTTAAALIVEGELLADSGSVETSEVTIDYVPSEGSRAAGLFFSRDPRLHRLEIRPKGYDRP